LVVSPCLDNAQEEKLRKKTKMFQKVPLFSGKWSGKPKNGDYKALKGYFRKGNNGCSQRNLPAKTGNRTKAFKIGLPKRVK